MATEHHAWEADWVVPPGEFLLEELQDRNMSQTELARRMGRPVKTINEIVNGKAAITPDTAIQLELTLGISARYWTGLENVYREHLARQRSLRELEMHADWAKRFPLKELRRYGLIPTEASMGAVVGALLSFFAVGSREAWEAQWGEPSAAFRRSEVYQASREATAAWLRWGEIEAAREDTPAFIAERLREVLPQVRRLTRLADFARAVGQTKELFRTAGVVLVAAPEFQGTRASGAAHWASGDKAVIQVSMRYKTDDQFWFTVFHEAGHLLEGSRTSHVDSEPEPEDANEAEAFANRFARDALIPAHAYAMLCSGPDLSPRGVAAFAEEQGIGPGIVAGRLYRDRAVERPRLDKLKLKIDWARVAPASSKT